MNTAEKEFKEKVIAKANEIIKEKEDSKPKFPKPTGIKDMFKELPPLGNTPEGGGIKQLKNVLKAITSQKGQAKASRDVNTANYLKRRAEIKRELKLAKKNKEEARVKELKELYDSITITKE